MDLEAAPLDGQQGIQRSHDKGGTQPMTQEEEGVVALGSNSMGVHTIQLRNKPKTKKSKPNEFNNRMSLKGLRLRITEHDVYMTLALPKGPLELPTLRGWTNDKVKSREEQEFEVGCGKGSLEDYLDETLRPDEAQVVHEEEPSNATLEATAEAEHDTVRSKIKALLKDAKKASNEIITNTRVLAGVITELEKLVPEAHASLKRVRIIAVQTTTDTLFTEITLPGKSKSTKPVLSPNPYESEDFLLAVEAIEKQFLTAQKTEHHFPQFTPPSFSLGLSQEENERTTTHLFIREVEHEEESATPATRVMIRELDVDVPLRDIQEASYVVKSNGAMKPEHGGQRTPYTFLSCYSGAWM
ncbi:hypothetical protein Cgig2_006481 [Carnegiea gigantea]|uniref:Uncharacterized protein n=1 Tax=Carnegiea gigantea TaxID=171969 RepID=A0A9Q1JTA1_9CARY|nr:hypothetical protein Cgig2_006481 [Carnegiea gigantea]